MKKHLIFLLSVILTLNYLNLAANDYFYGEMNTLNRFEGDLCEIRIFMWSTGGTGWYNNTGIEITVDGVDYGTVNFPPDFGNYELEEMVLIPSGEVLFSWKGQFDAGYTGFKIYNTLGELIYTSPDYPNYLTPGVFFTYQNECPTYADCLPITDFEGVYTLEIKQVNLTWIAPESDYLKGFDIYRNEELIDQLLPVTTFYTDNTEDLENGAYKYCVIPVYPFVCDLENECFEISIGGCLPITDFEGVYIAEEHNVNLNWNAPESADLTGFDIFRNDVVIEHLPSTATSYSDNTADLESGDYKYCVTPVYPFACTFVEECFEISINVSIVDYKDNILIYPNPANNIINVTGANIANVKIFNNIGQLILTQYNTNTIKVSGLTNGLYLLTIETSTGNTAQKKLIINH